MIKRVSLRHLLGRKYLALVLCGYALTYFAFSAAWIFFRPLPSLTGWYPATGLNLGLMMVLGPSWAPVVFVAQLAAWVFLYQLPLNTYTLALHLAVMALYLAAALVLRRLIPDGGRRVHLREALMFLFVAVITGLFSAFLTARLMLAGGVLSPLVYRIVFSQLIVRQILSNVVAGPLMVLALLSTVARRARSAQQPGQYAAGKTRKILGRPATDGGVALLHFFAVTLTVWMVFALISTSDWRIWFLIFLPLVLVVYHYDLRGAIIASFLINSVAIFTAHNFNYPPADYENVILFLMLLSIAAMMLGAAFSEGRDAERALRYRLGIEETISRISSRFINVQAGQVEEEIRRALGDLCAFTGVEVSHLCLFDANFTISRVYEWLAPGIPSRVENLHGSSMQDLPWLLSELQAGRAVYMPDQDQLPLLAVAEKRHFEANVVHSLVTVPLLSNGVLTGSLGFHNQEREKRWTSDDIRMLTLAGQIFLNVIERARAEARIRESDMKFRGLVLQSYDGVLLINKQGQITEWNRSMERITGWNRSDALGRYVWEIYYELLTPRARATLTLESIRNNILLSLSGSAIPDENRVREFELLRSDGSVRLIHSLTFPLRSAQGMMLGSVMRDMTDVRLGAEELRRSQANLAEAERLAQMGHYRFRVSDGSMEWSEETYRIAGMQPHEPPLPIQRILSFIVSDDQEAAADAIRTVLQDKQPASAEYRIHIPNGPVKTLYSIIRPEIDANGDITHIFGTVMDITERREASEALRESELRYKELADSVSDYFFGLDWDLRITYWNPAAERLTSFAAADVIGKTLYEVYPQFRGSSAEQFALEAIRTRQRQGFVMEWLSSHNLHYLEVNGYPGKHGLSVFMRDVTERQLAEERLRQSEARYRAVVEDQTDLISRFLPDGTMTFVNEAYCRMLGVSRAEVVGRRFYTYNISFGDRDLNGECCMLHTNADAITYETQELLSDGNVHWVQWMDRPILDDHNRVIEYQSVGRDISESKRLEEELRYLSTHDMLTGLYNRAFFETELQRLQRSRQYPISILMMDVNGLKDTNDTRGHAMGDALLQAAARVLSASFRPEDIVSRFGGDEFAVLLPGLDLAAAEEVVLRVRANQESYNLSARNMRLSLSLGIATARQNGSLVEALSTADRRMYQDKNRQKGTHDLPTRPV